MYGREGRVYLRDTLLLWLLAGKVLECRNQDWRLVGFDSPPWLKFDAECGLKYEWLWECTKNHLTIHNKLPLGKLNKKYFYSVDNGCDRFINLSGFALLYHDISFHHWIINLYFWFFGESLWIIVGSLLVRCKVLGLRSEVQGFNFPAMIYLNFCNQK